MLAGDGVIRPWGMRLFASSGGLCYDPADQITDGEVS